MSLAANIRQQRKRVGLTQIEFAEKLGVSIATLRRWESGETSPSGARIIEMANFLKVSPDDIISGDASSGVAGHSSILLPASEYSNGMLVYEGEGTRIELPPTEQGYELFRKLVENLITSRNALKEQMMKEQEKKN